MELTLNDIWDYDDTCRKCSDLHDEMESQQYGSSYHRRHRLDFTNSPLFYEYNYLLSKIMQIDDEIKNVTKYYILA
jgi:hypothetical protein